VATVEKDKSPEIALQRTTPQDQGLDRPLKPAKSPVDMADFGPSHGTPHLSALLQNRQIAVNVDALVTRIMGGAVEEPASSVLQQADLRTEQADLLTQQADLPTREATSTTPPGTPSLRQATQSTQEATSHKQEADPSVPASVQSIVRRILDEHQAGNLTRKWLVKTFPTHFEAHRDRLRKSSGLRTYGPEKLGVDQTLWLCLTGDDGS